MSAIARRRLVAKRLGLFVLLLVAASACIFDKGDYQGGGRDHTVKTPNTDSTSAAPPPSPPPAGDAGSG
jgi:hypothetical protein